MSQYPPPDPNYPPYPGGQSGPYGAPDPYGQPAQPQYPQYPQQLGGYGAPQPASQYEQQPAYPGYPQAPAQPQYPGYGTPSQYGAPTPQSQYGYPQGPGYPGGPGLPPSSNRGTITGITIAAVVVVAAVVGVFVLRNLTGGTSFAGQWYGPIQYTPAAGTSYSPYTSEAYMTLSQDTSNTVTGSGRFCLNVNGSVREVTFTVSGKANGNNANLALTGTSSSTSNTVTDVAALSGGNMSFSETDPTGVTAGSLQNGGSSASSNYSSACQSLPPLQTGG